MPVNVNGPSSGDDRLGTDAGPAIGRSLSPCAPGAVAALSPLAAGAALKLKANKIAESAISAVGRVIWSAEAQVEFFCGFSMGFLGLNHLGQSWRGKKDEDKSAISRSVNSGVARHSAITNGSFPRAANSSRRTLSPPVVSLLSENQPTAVLLVPVVRGVSCFVIVLMFYLCHSCDPWSVLSLYGLLSTICGAVLPVSIWALTF